MKARPFRAIKVYVFLHELQPPCQQLMPSVTRSKPRYSLAFGEDNMHLRLCKGIFCRARSRLTVRRGRSGWAPDVVTFSYDRKEKRINPQVKTSWATWESRGVAASQSDRLPDPSHGRHSNSAARPAARRLHFAFASAHPVRQDRVAQTDKTSRQCVLRLEI